MIQLIWYPRETNLALVRSTESTHLHLLTLGLDEFWMVESRNVIVRLTGKSNNTNESFLVNAHYGKSLIRCLATSILTVHVR